MLFLSSVDFFKINFPENSFRKTIRSSYSLDPDQALHVLGLIRIQTVCKVISRRHWNAKVNTHHFKQQFDEVEHVLKLKTATQMDKLRVSLSHRNKIHSKIVNTENNIEI